MSRLWLCLCLLPLPLMANTFSQAEQDPLTEAQRHSRFLTQSTFGPSVDSINSLKNTPYSEWFTEQLNLPKTFASPLIEGFSVAGEHGAGMAFWQNAITAKDQLRQRMAFALSQIFVISDFNENQLFDHPNAVAAYQDLLTEHAFGNYRDLLEAVTYSPAMGYYLTYMGSEKGDKETGRVPDENYAREILQLFSIGLVELNPDGTPVLNANAKPVETYSNQDITGLAKVFTGLNLNETDFYDEEGDLREDVLARLNLDEAFFDEEELEEEERLEGAIENLRFTLPMETFEDSHSDLEKRFLGLTIAADTQAKDSISLALDHIFNHKNVAPFISRQLIQRFVTSHPSPQYVQRVAQSFRIGRFQLPNGDWVGLGKRGDLSATLAAILFDENARADSHNDQVSKQFGKVREPILRFTAWARAFDLNAVTPLYMFNLWDTSSNTDLGQHPYRSPTVFNYYQPHYIAQGSQTGMANLNMPELQLVNASTIPSYINFMSFFINGEMRDEEYLEEYQEFIEEEELDLSLQKVKQSFYAPYGREVALADQPWALVAHLDTLLTYGRLSSKSKHRIKKAITLIPVREKQARVKMAILMVMTSPEFLVQG